MIVGNKIDLEEKRVVSKQRGLEYAESKKIAFYEVSAKDGTNINLIFTRIAEGTYPPMQNWKRQSPLITNPKVPSSTATKARRAQSSARKRRRIQ
jgi:Ras-related protein Rab-6A